jgi:N-acyl-D-aspartate/D-glutamate deacylase
MADIVLRGGEIINGEGHPAVSGDVVVDGGTIVSTSSQSTTEANLEFDVQGKIVCPGFIDIHSHSDFSLMADRRNEGAIRQGITTLVTGNCGHGPAHYTIWI